jgi:hypothetical protein
VGVGSSETRMASVRTASPSPGTLTSVTPPGSSGSPNTSPTSRSAGTPSMAAPAGLANRTIVSESTISEPTG